MLNNLPAYVATYHPTLDFYPSSFTALKNVSYIIIQKVWNLLSFQGLTSAISIFNSDRKQKLSTLAYSSDKKENADILAKYILDEIIYLSKIQQKRCDSFLISSEHIYNAVFLDGDLRYLCWNLIKSNPDPIISTEEIKKWGNYEFADYEALALVINHLLHINYKPLLEKISIDASFENEKTELIIKILVLVKDSIKYVKELASSDIIIIHIINNYYLDLKSWLS